MNIFKSKWWGWNCGLVLACFLFQVSVALAGEVLVAVASNFTFPLKELSRELENTTGDKSKSDDKKGGEEHFTH